MTDQTITRPTPERMRQGGVIVAEEQRGARPKPWNAATALCDHYLLDGEITERQWRAGDSFTRLYYRAQGSPWRVQSWETPVKGGTIELSDSRMAAQGSLTVTASRLGKDLYSVLRDVCGLHIAASRWARDKGEHPASGLPVLRIGLSLYADHIGLADA